MPALTFRHYKVQLVFAEYTNGNPAIQFYDAEDGIPILTASVNPPGEILEPGLVAIKNYSENEGVLAWLIEQGIVSPPLYQIPSGYVDLEVCRLLKKEA